MIRLFLLFILVFPLQLFAQRADSTLAHIYAEFIRELGKDYPVTSENIFVINDLYYPEYKETPSGYDPNVDTLVYSFPFREMTAMKMESITGQARTQFGPLPQYNALYAEINYEFTGPHKGRKMQFFYLEKPIDNKDYYDLSFNDLKEFVIYIPVHLYKSNGASYEGQVNFYEITGDAKGKLTIKKLG